MTVESADGTLIGFDRLGAGPGMVLVHGGTVDRTSWAPVLRQLAERFTLHVVDRRGRGLSARENGPYAIEREGEDIAAVAEAAGRDVCVVGHSYGALCGLEAALASDSIGRLFLYEPGLSTPGFPVAPPGAVDWLRENAADREKVLETVFLGALQMSPAEIDAVRSTPMWQVYLAIVPTLARELDAAERYTALDRLAKIDIPVRILLGTESAAYFRPAAEAIARHVQQTDFVDLVGQEHKGIDRDPEQLVAKILDFTL